MKKLLSILGLLGLALHCSAGDGAWIFGTNVLRNAHSRNGAVITATPLSNRVVLANGSLASTFPVTLTNDANGSIGSNYLIGGPYRMNLPETADTFIMWVPTDEAAHDWLTLSTNSFNFTANANAPFIAVNQGTGRSNVLIRPRIFLGTNTSTIGTNTSGQANVPLGITNALTGEIGPLGTGAGDVTTSQLLAASNALSAPFVDVTRAPYNATGDLVSVSVAISSNLFTLTNNTTSFVAADVGKTVAIFGAGKTNADLVAIIATVNSGVATLDHRASNTVTAARALVFTDNRAAFSNALAAADNLYVPKGDYGFVPLGWDNFNPDDTTSKIPCLIIGRNNIRIRGTGYGTNGSRLSFVGAFKRTGATESYVHRPSGIRLANSLTNIALQDLEIWGGLTNGNDGVTTWPPNPVNGAGWDLSQHLIWVDNGGVFSSQSLENFRIERSYLHDCRGEVIYSGAEDTGRTFILDSILGGTSASLVNMNCSVTCIGTTFRDYDKPAEHAQSQRGSSIYENCVFSNGNAGFSIVVARTNNTHPVIIRNSLFTDIAGNAIDTDNGKDIDITQNRFFNVGRIFQLGLGFGTQGTEPYSKNVSITRNFVTATNAPGHSGVAITGGTVDGMVISANTFDGLNVPVDWGGGGYTNVLVSENTYMRCTHGATHNTWPGFGSSFPLFRNESMIDGSISTDETAFNSLGANTLETTYLGERIRLRNSGSSGMVDVTLKTGGIPDRARITYTIEAATSGPNTAPFRFVYSSSNQVERTRIVRNRGDLLTFEYDAALAAWREVNYAAAGDWKIASAAPTTGAWDAGEEIFSSVQSNVTFVCISNGSPGIWITNVGINTLQVRSDAIYDLGHDNLFTVFSPKLSAGNSNNAPWTLGYGEGVNPAPDTDVNKFFTQGFNYNPLGGARYNSNEPALWWTMETRWDPFGGSAQTLGNRQIEYYLTYIDRSNNFGSLAVRPFDMTLRDTNLLTAQFSVDTFYLQSAVYNGVPKVTFDLSGRDNTSGAAMTIGGQILVDTNASNGGLLVLRGGAAQFMNRARNKSVLMYLDSNPNGNGYGDGNFVIEPPANSILNITTFPNFRVSPTLVSLTNVESATLTNIAKITIGASGSRSVFSPSDAGEVTLFDATGTNYGTFKANMFVGSTQVGQTPATITGVSNITASGTVTTTNVTAANNVTARKVGVNTNAPTAEIELQGDIQISTLTANTLLKANGTKKVVSVANGTGVYTNDGSGNIGVMPIPSSGGTPGGNSGAIQFAEGTSFAGTNDIDWDRTNLQMAVRGSIAVTNPNGSSIVLSNGQMYASTTNLIGSTVYPVGLILSNATPAKPNNVANSPMIILSGSASNTSPSGITNVQWYIGSSNTQAAGVISDLFFGWGLNSGAMNLPFHMQANPNSVYSPVGLSASVNGSYCLNVGGPVNSAASFTTEATGNYFGVNGRSRLYSGADGIWQMVNSSSARLQGLEFGNAATIADPMLASTNGDFLVMSGDRKFDGGETNRLRVFAGASSNTVTVGGTMVSDLTSYTNLNGTPTTFTNLGAVILAANTFTNDGDSLKIWWAGFFQISAVNTNEFKITSGANSPLDTGLQLSSNGTFKAECTLTRRSKNAIGFDGSFTFNGGTLGNPWITTNAAHAILALDTGTNNTFALQGASQRVGAHTNDTVLAQFLPAKP